MAEKQFLRGVRDFKIAQWLSEDSWGTFYDVLGIRNASVAVEGTFETLRGDDVDLDQFGKLTGLTITWEQAAFDLEVVEMLSGGSLVSNADYEDVVITENSDPLYLGVAWRIVASGGLTDTHFFAPKCKLQSALNFQAQLDQYMLPNTELHGVNEGDTNGILRVRRFSAPTALEIPLRTSTGGL